MSNSIIHFLFNLKDENIIFTGEFYNKTTNGVTYKHIVASVDEHFDFCPHCKAKLIKYGTKCSKLKFLMYC